MGHIALPLNLLHGGLNLIFSYLLKQGADIRPTGKSKYHNALQIASVSGNKAIVKALLRHGFDINTIGGKFGTALTAAILHNDIEIAELLLKRGIDPNGPGGIYSGVLQAAAATGSIPGNLLLNFDTVPISIKLEESTTQFCRRLPYTEMMTCFNFFLNGALRLMCLVVIIFLRCMRRRSSPWEGGCEALMKNGAQWSLIE